MAKLLITIILLMIAVSIIGKPGYRQFRIQISPKNGYTLYIPEYREKKSLFGRQWWPITPYIFYDLRSAQKVVEDAKFEDSLTVAHAKSQYIYFK